jgi:GalNAc-alpha-(1->4)-GalNAc-alpha-(1->3)-diNAcBac-PP-undecaprenol alpha-1,4-N-acetyl-D-galactosaminyltransferase
MRADRITIVVASLDGGGAERVVIDLSRYLSNAGRKVTLLTLDGNVADLYSVPHGVRRERIGISHSAKTLLEKVGILVAGLRAMRQRIVSLCPDVVVSFVDQTNVRTLCCLVGTGVPVIVSERIHPAHNRIGRLWLIARHLSYPFASAVTVQTKEGAEWFGRSTRVKGVVVIPNAVRFPEDIQTGVGRGSGLVPRPVAVAMGRLVQQKGFDLLLKAFHQSGLADERWHLAILGKGPEQEALRLQARALGLAEVLTLPGFVSDPDVWLRQADFFVLPSRFEGFPNALLEAMQAGVPSISFDCPSGPRELIEDGVNGCLVPAEDVDALSAAMRRLGHDPDLRKRLGAEAIKVNQRFDSERVYSRWLQLMDSVVAGKFKHRKNKFDESE